MLLQNQVIKIPLPVVDYLLNCTYSEAKKMNALFIREM